MVSRACADPENFLSGGVQIPRRGLTENFNMAKINNLAIPGGVRTPCPPSGSAYVETYSFITVLLFIDF